MSDEIEDYWPNEIRVNARTPETILNHQAVFLARKTRGIVRAQVRSNPTERGLGIYFDLVSGAADRYRIQLILVTHALDRAYPCAVSGEPFHSEPGLAAEFKPASNAMYRSAPTEDAFNSILASVLRSTTTRGILESLIARCNTITPAESDPPSEAVQSTEQH